MWMNFDTVYTWNQIVFFLLLCKKKDKDKKYS